MLWCLTSINREYSPNTIALLGCICSRWNMSCRLLAPEGSAFFWSSCFAAPRLLPCCPQLAEVKPCPKYPCTPSESYLGFIAAISFTCAVRGQDRKSRNCPSLAAVSKCMSQPGTRGTNCRAVSLHPWWKNLVGNQGQSGLTIPITTDPAVVKTLSHCWDALTWIVSSPPT